MGLSIFCLGACQHMIAHLDGLARDWALTIKDWDAFNKKLEGMTKP